MRAFNRFVIRSLTTSFLALATLLAVSGCKREDAAAPARAESAPASRAESKTTPDWAQIEVDPNPGWDPAEIRRIAIRELEVCREVLEKGAGIPFDSSRSPIAVRFVHDENTLHDLYRVVPRSERVLSWRGRAFYRSDPNQLVLTRDAEVLDRSYLFSLALVMTHAGFGPINFVDSVAMWMSGMALNRLLGEPLWRRGRVLNDFREFGLKAGRLQEACVWASLPLSTDLDLTWGRDVITGLDLDLEMVQQSDIDLGDQVRRMSCFLVYFLANFALTPEGVVAFDATPKYETLLRALLAKPDPPQRTRLCLALSVDHAMVSECSAYMDFLRRKRNLGQSRGGLILSAAEAPPNRKGVKTAVPEDDLLKSQMTTRRSVR